MTTAPQTFLVLTLALTLATGTRSDQGDTNAAPAASGYIERFEIPERDSKGNLRTIFKGDKATFLPDGQMDVSNLRAEFYTSNRVAMVFSAPACRVDQANKRGTTAGPIQLERATMLITGVGADWTDAQKLINIHSNVRVVLTEGGLLPAPTGKTP